jgi:hypothetical protein
LVSSTGPRYIGGASHRPLHGIRVEQHHEFEEKGVASCLSHGEVVRRVFLKTAAGLRTAVALLDESPDADREIDAAADLGGKEAVVAALSELGMREFLMRGRMSAF